MFKGLDKTATKYNQGKNGLLQRIKGERGIRVKWSKIGSPTFFEEYEENVGNSDKEAIAYLVLDEAEILLKTIQGHDKVCDPPPLLMGVKE